jgi:hypothetical protein
VSLETIVEQRLGFIDGTTYRRWVNSLSDNLREHLTAAGLPDVKRGRPMRGHAAMFAGGYQGKIVFPYFDEVGHVIDIRTRSISDRDTIGGNRIRYTSPKLSYDQRGVYVPYGVDAIGNANRIGVTEGEFKALVPMSQGLSTPIVALRGTNDMRAEYLEYFQGKHVMLLFDNDAAGQMATVNVGRFLRAHDVSVTVVNPSSYGEYKGIDDLVNGAGVDALVQLVEPGRTMTLSQFEAELERNGTDLSKVKRPKADPGVKRYWAPADQVDRNAHVEQPTVSLEEAREQIRTATRRHLNRYRRGRPQLMITSTAGTGKTTIALEEARNYTAENGGTMAVFFPNHATIDEKIADSTLEGFKHIYGRRDDDDIQNCQKAESAQALAKKGYNVSAVLCSGCEFLNQCRRTGYHSQFNGKENRAYVLAHLHTDYPEGEDVVVVDELSHKAFVDEVSIFVGDIAKALQSAELRSGPRRMLEALLNLFHRPDLADLNGYEFYECLAREFSEWQDVDLWGDGLSVQEALSDLAIGSFMFGQGNAYIAEELPDQFGQVLFAILSEDVRRIVTGKSPTGRIRFVCTPNGRYIQLTYSKGRLPAWYSKRPTMVLNATGDADLMNDLIGPIEVVAPVVAMADGTEFIHDVTFNNSKTSVKGDSDDAQRRQGAWLERIGAHIADEADTTIIVAKALQEAVQSAFPRANVGYYHALEGRNDLQASTTILANSPPVNLDAVRREAAALYPGVNTSLTRSLTAFEYADASGRLLSTEQIDAVDPRVQRILDQHRDAAVIQAVHRARIVVHSGRKVVAMFSRPIPGLRPTQAVTERPTQAQKADLRTQEAIDKLLSAARELVEEHGGFALTTLYTAADVSKSTAWKYWEDVTTQLKKEMGARWFDMPCLQPLVSGGKRSVVVRVVLSDEIVQNAKMSVVRGRYNSPLIAFANDRQLGVLDLIPGGWEIDAPDTEHVPPEAPSPETLDAIAQTLIDAITEGHIAQAEYRALTDSLYRTGLGKVLQLETRPPEDRFSRRQGHMLIENAADALRTVQKLAQELGATL